MGRSSRMALLESGDGRTDGIPHRRRSLPSSGEQERRQAWGKKWGPLLREASRKAMEELNRDE
jgi:hypothetical protein